MVYGVFAKCYAHGHPSQITVVDCDFAKVGLSICYDVRFPEMYRRLVKLGATILVVPSAFTQETGEKHWLTLLKARAIENQCFVLAANQFGQYHSDRNCYGHSCIIAPEGDVLAMQETGEGVILADCDLKGLQQYRQEFPCLRHRIIGV